MAAADATTELKVGALVFDNDYKHPVVLAKELATIDVLSGGRLEVGIGAGWMKSDYDQSGIPMDPPGRAGVPHGGGHRRHQGLLRRRARTPSTASTTRSPATTACPSRCSRRRPFLIGGGAKRVLSIAAREAQIVGHQPVDPQRPGRRGRRPERRRRRDRPEAPVGEGGRRRPLRRPRDQPAAVRRHRHRRPRGHRRDDGAAVRAPARGARHLPPRLHRHDRRDRRVARGAARALGRVLRRVPGRHAWRPWPPWSPSSAAPEPAMAGDAADRPRLRRRRVDRGGPRLRRRPRARPADQPRRLARPGAGGGGRRARVGAKPCTYDELPAGAAGVVVCTPPAQHLEHARHAIAGGARRAHREAAVHHARRGRRAGRRRPTPARASPTPRTSPTRRSCASPSPTPPSCTASTSSRCGRCSRGPTWGDFLTEGWGGGVLFDLGVHPLAVALLLAAPAVPVEVQRHARGRRRPPGRRARRGADPLRHRPPRPGARRAGAAATPRPGTPRCPRPTAWCASSCCPSCCSSATAPRCRCRASPRASPGSSRSSATSPQIESFALDLQQGRSPELGAAFGRRILDIVCAAYASAGQGGEWIALPFAGPRDRTPLQLWRG